MKLNKRQTVNNKEQNKFITALWGFGIGLFCIAVGLFVSPLILLKISDPKGAITITAAICVFLASLVSGIFCGIKSRSSALTATLLTGGMIFVILTMLSIFIKGSFDFTTAWIMALSDFGGAFLGFFLTNKPQKSKGKQMKKLMKRR